MPLSFQTMLSSRQPFVLLEDRLAKSAPARLYRDPVEIVSCVHGDEVPAALRRIEDGLARGLHAAGFLGYELGYAFEPRLVASMPSKRALPLLWFGLFREPLEVAPVELDRHFAGLAPPLPLGLVQPRLEASAHAAKVARVLEYLQAGDAYQINLTFPVDFHYDGDPLALYAALRASQPVSHGGIVAFEDATILSVSPELFLEVESGRATTRPMKGTASRLDDPEADRAAKAALQADPKQRAENLMIVDLLRNDLGRISVLGSVEVPSLFKVETYPTFHTLTSTVTSSLLPGLSLEELMRATFPCGSITGAPKLRAMQIIREIEDGPRDVYTGAIGAIAPNGDLRFNVAIRTAAIFPDGVGRYGIGGGIVADSEAASEYAEALLKARVLTDLAEDYGLIETLRWSGETGFVRLQLHLDRLERSASALDFSFDRHDAQARLDSLAASFDRRDDRRIRLELRRDGALDFHAPVLAEEPERRLGVIVAADRIDAADPFLRHKTTRRRLFETAYAAAVMQGADEAIFLNRAGFVTESARSTIFVERGGVLLTPPLSDGVLPGVLRQSLIGSGEAIERQLVLDDLARAERWFLGNSLRGLRRAQLGNP
ncbi:aminodeoxychorismate synthase component I [Bosea vaviloviae]|uniref:Probable branched-chain-amino-acid aminotransferase n=1 Tax=Bosea vaviloviae TaxID=1526658 RepID=A0A1D7U5H5_9HYPH|nr:aminodeoxychorismate synthase component I [Bosea vaviloviae]AOO82594.1 aminodeoxychorismate synthase, component I [Bosea vaviloviae]